MFWSREKKTSKDEKQCAESFSDSVVTDWVQVLLCVCTSHTRNSTSHQRCLCYRRGPPQRLSSEEPACTAGCIPGSGRSLEEEMATLVFSPWAEEPGGPQCIGSQKVRLGDKSARANHKRHVQPIRKKRRQKLQTIQQCHQKHLRWSLAGRHKTEKRELRHRLGTW